MTDDLVKRLRAEGYDTLAGFKIKQECADRIEELERAVLDLVQYVSRADLAFYTKTETRLVFRKLMEKHND
jgi:hypothetical protein